MEKRKARRSRGARSRTRPHATPAQEMTPSFAEQINFERRRIFMAMGIVSCCRYASDSMLEPQDGEPDLVEALAAAHELLDDIAERLEFLTSNSPVLDTKNSLNEPVR